MASCESTEQANTCPVLIHARNRNISRPKLTCFCGYRERKNALRATSTRAARSHGFAARAVPEIAPDKNVAPECFAPIGVRTAVAAAVAARKAGCVPASVPLDMTEVALAVAAAQNDRTAERRADCYSAAYVGYFAAFAQTARYFPPASAAAAYPEAPRGRSTLDAASPGVRLAVVAARRPVGSHPDVHRSAAGSERAQAAPRVSFHDCRQALRCVPQV